MSVFKRGEKVLLEVMFKETLGLSGKATIEPIVGPMPSGVTVEVDLKHVRQWTPAGPEILWADDCARVCRGGGHVWVEARDPNFEPANWIMTDDGGVVVRALTAYAEGKP